MTSAQGPSAPGDAIPGSHGAAGGATAGSSGEPASPARGALPQIDRSLPPDPVAYDSERAALARARGLSAPYIAGGRDPDPEAGRREERFYGRVLLAMVIAVVLGGFVLGILGNVITALRGG